MDAIRTPGRRPLRFAAMLVAAFASVIVAGASPQQGSAQHHHAPPAADGAFDIALRAAMDRMHHDMMAPAPSGDPDLDFLATMIPHHQGAVEMARLVLIHGKDTLVRRLAEEIIAAQQAEIAAMRGRLEILRRGADPDPGGFPSLGGTRGPAP